MVKCGVKHFLVKGETYNLAEVYLVFSHLKAFFKSGQKITIQWIALSIFRTTDPGLLPVRAQGVLATK